MKTTKEKVKAALTIAQAVAEVIRDLEEIPSGHLYAMVMDKMSLQDYEALIGLLVRSKVVERSNHLLKWIGPNKN